MKLTILLFVSSLLFFGCKVTTTPVTTNSEDSSSSGLAASSVGGAVGSSDTNGTIAMMQAPKPIWSILLQPAFAVNTCPKITTANGSGCSNAGNAVDLTYTACTVGNGGASWTGIMEVTLSTGTAVSCGTFPSPNNQSLQRQFVASAGVKGTGSRTTSKGTVVVIDHSTANLGNFDGQVIAANIGTGYGTTVGFTGTVRSSVQVRQRLYVSGGFDHSIDGSITLAESGTTRTSNGSIKVYHNILKVVGTSTFTNVVYNNTSCVPVSGSISTAFAAGTNVSPTTLGALLVGKTETLTFAADGTATLVDNTGATSTVALTHCY